MQASALDRWLLSALIATLLTAVPATAQDKTTPPWEIFTGYSYAHPGGTVILPLKNQPYGFGVGVTRNFNNWFGITLDIAGHYSGSATASEKNSMIHTLMVGPKFTFRRSSLWQPFAEGLIGLNRISPGNIEADNGITGNNHAPAFALGGGLDVPVKRYLALRLIQADYEYGYHDFHGEENSFPIGASLNGTVKGYRVQAGLTWRLGIHETILPKSADCSVQPQEVFAGESITASVIPVGFPAKDSLLYSWASTSGNVQSNASSATLDTTRLAPGRYDVNVTVTDPTLKNNKSAMCFVGFAVKEYPKHPPTMSCSAEPGSVTLGGSSQITCSCGSPDNVPLTIGDWQATSGTLSPNGNVATLQTAGVTASSIEVRSRCSDARGLLANAMVNVHVEAPPPPPPITPEVQRLEARLALHSIYFPTAQPPPDNPQGGLLPSQQQTLVTLASDFLKYIDAKPDARLVLEGHADVRGSVEYNQGLSERRVNRARQFLIDRGVPADKLDTRAFGKQRNLSDAEVTDSIQHNPELSAEERARILRNLRTIGLANNRRVDITLFATGQTSVRQYPFNAADSLTLIGGREGAAHKKPATKTRKRR